LYGLLFAERSSTNLNLKNFGSFNPTFNSKTEATADAVSADNVTRNKILFYPGKRFKQMLSGMALTTIDDYGEEGTSLPEEPGDGN
jgi:hypothetical protein